MSDQRFDLSYKGLIAPGADPERTRSRLSDIFKLTEKGAERLFTGRPVIVKRGADAATAARFEKIFAHAGATLTVTPVNHTGGPASEDRAVSVDPPESSLVHAIDTSHLSLVAPPYDTLEEPLAAGGPDLDLSYLELVPGDDWTLEDCEPPPTPTPEPDITYLSLEPLVRRADQNPDQGLD